MSLCSRSSLAVLLAAAILGAIDDSPQASSAFVYPVGDPNTTPSRLDQRNGYKIVRGFGVHVSEGQHTGVDLANGQEGGDVRSIAAGIVTEVRLVAPDAASGFGNLVRIRHNILGVGTVYSQYAHLMDGSIEVAPNEPVEAGTVIGRIDCTGYTFGPTTCPSNGKKGPHLHFSIQVMDRRGCGYLPDSRCPDDTLVNYFNTDPLDLIEGWRAGSAMDDDFNDNSLDSSRWFVTISPPGTGTVTETNQQLEMLRTQPGSGYLGLLSKCSVSGDFDVRVDFRLLNWPPDNRHTVRLAAQDLSPQSIGHLGIYRNSYGDENYEFRADGVIGVSVVATAGTMRLTRVGSTVRGFYTDGAGLLQLGSTTATTNNTDFLLDFSSPESFAPGNIHIAFDNFRVNSGTVVCPQ